MSTISATSSASSAWSDARSSRISARQDKMFAKVDADGSGSVDKTELQGLLDHIAKKTGKSLGSADDVMAKLDSNGDGSLSKDELKAGMKSLMPAPKSTVDFAHKHGGGPRPPDGDADDASGASAASASSGTSSTSASTDPLDANGDGTVSAQERAAGAMKDVMKALMAAADTDGDKKISKSEAQVFKSQVDTAVHTLSSGSSASGSSGGSDPGSSSSDPMSSAFTALASLVLKQYSQAAANSSQASTLSVAA